MAVFPLVLYYLYAQSKKPFFRFLILIRANPESYVDVFSAPAVIKAMATFLPDAEGGTVGKDQCRCSVIAEVDYLLVGDYLPIECESFLKILHFDMYFQHLHTDQNSTRASRVHPAYSGGAITKEKPGCEGARFNLPLIRQC